MKNTTTDSTDIQIINWNKYEINTQGTPLFLDKRPWKNPMQENQCSSSEGFLLLRSSTEYNSGCPLSYPITEIKYTCRNISEITSLHPEKSLWSDNRTDYPRLQLCCPFALVVSAYVEHTKRLRQLCVGSSTSWSSDISLLNWSYCSLLNSDFCRSATPPLCWHCLRQCVGPSGPASASLGLRFLLWLISASLCCVFGVLEKIL